MAARSTLLGVRHREHFTSSHGNPPLIAWPIVGERSTSFRSSFGTPVFGFADQRLADTPFFLRTLG
jgi:hypothetical protein